jgi:hypothetical protein
MTTLDYQPPRARKPSQRRWIRNAAAVTLFDFACAVYVGRHVVINGSWGGIYGFNGFARPVIFATSLFNLFAFALVMGVLFTNTSRYRWWLCLTFLVHAFVALIFLPAGYGWPPRIGR